MESPDAFLARIGTMNRRAVDAASRSEEMTVAVGFNPRFVAPKTSSVAERRPNAVCPTIHASLRDARRCTNLRSVGSSQAQARIGAMNLTTV